MALLVKADGTTKIIQGDNDGELSLAMINNMVGGYFQHVLLNPPLVVDGKEYAHFLCDEDGKRKNYPVNMAASDYLVGKWLDSSDFIVGDVLLLEVGEIS